MYFKKVQENNLTYSIDMLRLRCDMPIKDFRKLEMILRLKENVEKYWEAFSITDFRYNYTLKDDCVNTFWIGYIHNSENITDDDRKKYNFTIEFNPNKLKDAHIIKYILSYARKWSLKQFDVAIDVPISILDICGLNKKRFKDIRIFNNGYDNKTFYIGRTNNRVKIYNKKIESNLDISGELTRVEITSKQDYLYSALDYFNVDLSIPDLFTNDYMYTFKDYEDKTLLAILYAVQNGFNINDLTRTYKDKITNLLEGGHKIEIDIKCIRKVLNEVLRFYLGNLYN